MPVVSQTKKLNVNASHGLDQTLISVTLFFRIRFCSIRYVCILWFDVHPVEQMLMHKVIIALIIVSGQASVLIQIHCFHF